MSQGPSPPNANSIGIDPSMYYTGIGIGGMDGFGRRMSTPQVGDLSSKVTATTT